MIKTNVSEEIILKRTEERFNRGEGSGIRSYYTTKNEYQELKKSEYHLIDNNGNLDNLIINTKTILKNIRSTMNNN